MVATELPIREFQVTLPDDGEVVEGAVGGRCQLRRPPWAIPHVHSQEVVATPKGVVLAPLAVFVLCLLDTLSTGKISRKIPKYVR